MASGPEYEGEAEQAKHNLPCAHRTDARGDATFRLASLQQVEQVPDKRQHEQDREEQHVFVNLACVVSEMPESGRLATPSRSLPRPVNEPHGNKAK